MVIRFEKPATRPETPGPKVLPFQRLTPREVEHRKRMLRHLEAVKLRRAQ